MTEVAVFVGAMNLDSNLMWPGFASCLVVCLWVVAVLLMVQRRLFLLVCRRA